MRKCLICDKPMTVLCPSESGEFREECPEHECGTQQMHELKLRHDCLRADLIAANARIEELRTVLLEVLPLIDGTYRKEMDFPIPAARVRKALEGREIDFQQVIRLKK